MLHRHRALPGTQPGQCSGKAGAGSGSGPGLAALSSPPEKEREAFMDRAAQDPHYAGEWLKRWDLGEGSLRTLAGERLWAGTGARTWSLQLGDTRGM